jgi:amicoumacin kinase
MIPIPEPALHALALKFAIDPAGLVKFAGGDEGSDGVVYAYPFEGQQRLLKILVMPPEKPRQGLFRLEERLRLMRFMGDGGAPVVFPITSPQNRLYETSQHDERLWVAYTMEHMPGKTPHGDRWDPEFYTSFGRLVGLTHRLATQYPSWEAAIDSETGEALLTWQEEWQDFYDWSKDDEVTAKWLSIRERLEKLPRSRHDFGFIHNDAHIWNLLVDDGAITLLDFDVANHHWFMADIAIACQAVLFDLTGGMNRPVHDQAKLREFVRLFMDGYRSQHPLDPAWLEQLDLFIAYRRILLFVVMHGWISSQPEMHAAWKAMILEEPEVAGRGWFS